MGEGGGGGGLKPPDFKLILLCVQAVTAKERPKFVIIKKQERKKQLSHYKYCYAYKNQSLEAGSTSHLHHMQYLLT